VTLRAGVDHQRLYFVVEDTGPGISAEEKSRLFEPFVQAEGGLNPSEGTGLGLAISQKFVRLLGGEIQIESLVGQGSAFRFSVEFDPVTADRIPANRSARRVVGVAASHPQYRILVVDDKPENRQLLVKLMSDVGLEVREAENGQQAIDSWQSWQPHLIWMDMRMPVMDGYEATQRIRAHLRGHATVIIGLTASAFEEQRSLVISAGCDDFLSKPFQANQLFEKMTQHLGVQWITEPLANDPLPEAVPRMILTPDQLAGLPADWLAALEQAAIQTDVEALQATIHQISLQEEALANGLRAWVAEFHFKEIRLLVQQARGQTR
jgi:CheY-like chemotaxis protein